MEKKFNFWSIMVILILCLFGTDVSKGEGVPESLTLIYFKDGRSMECEMGWIEGDTLRCRKYSGTISFPLENVDIEKTCQKSIETERKKVVTESTSETLHDDILVQGFRVVRNRQERRQSRHRRGMVFHEVSCTIRNLGDPCTATIGFVAITENGYTLKETRLRSKAKLWTGESDILREKVMICKEEDERIVEWKIEKIYSSGRIHRPKPKTYSRQTPKDSSVSVRKMSKVPERSRVLNELNSRELQDLSIIICKYSKKCDCQAVYGQMKSISKSSHDMFAVQCADGTIFCIHRLPEPPFWVVIQADPNGDFSECVIRTPDPLRTRNKK